MVSLTLECAIGTTLDHVIPIDINRWNLQRAWLGVIVHGARGQKGRSAWANGVGAGGVAVDVILLVSCLQLTSAASL